MEINNYKRKFKILFDKFFQENFELSDYYLENLLKFLQDSSDNSAGKILETPFFSDLILYSVGKIQTVTTSVKIFILELLSIALKNELQFIRLAEMKVFPLIDIKLHDVRSTPLAIAAINCATAHICHSTGLHWTINHKIWKHILFPNIHHRPIKISRAAYKYMAKLIWTLNEYEEETSLIEVLQFISEPLVNNPYQNLNNLDVESENTIYDPILPYLYTLMEILDDNIENLLKPNKVLPLLSTYFLVEPHISMMFEVTRDSDLACLISELCFKLCFAHINASKKKFGKSDCDVTHEIYTDLYNYIQYLIRKRMVFTTIEFVVRCTIFWNKLGSNMPSTFERYGKKFEIQDQFISILIVSIFKCAENHCYDKTLLEAVETYLMKLVNITTEHTIKVIYTFKSILEADDTKKIIILTIRQLFKLKGRLSAVQAGTVYQALYYRLRMYLTCDEKGDLIVNENPLKTQDDVILLSLTMDAIKMLLKEHNITWYQSCEIVCLQNVVMNLLKQSVLPTKLLIQALDLITVSINKFLSPDLTLLVESKSGSTLHEICSVMKSYIQHDEWEIRDSALNLLLSCTEVSFVKYRWLQKLISENSLLILATCTALHDPEIYVQTSALKCVAAAIKIESIWKEVLSVHPNLFSQLMYIMKYNSEGIVRKEAAKILTEIFINRKVKDKFTKCIYEVMFAAALEDLHWEVQMVALNFWKQVIKMNLSHRGMIDGKFPSVTFSREKRKIVVLNEAELHRQLTGIMNDLSSIGCLTILHKCLEEDHHIDVMEKAYDISKELISILNNYKFSGIESNDAIISNVHTIEIDDIICDELEDNPMDLSYAPKELTDNREEVINDIISANQADIILELYEQFNPVRTETKFPTYKIIKVTTMHPNTFLEHFRNTDYLTVIKNKKNWISGVYNLDMLLDEILDANDGILKHELECI